jgi:hypothetical protein
MKYTLPLLDAGVGADEPKEGNVVAVEVDPLVGNDGNGTLAIEEGFAEGVDFTAPGNEAVDSVTKAANGFNFGFSGVFTETNGVPLEPPDFLRTFTILLLPNSCLLAGFQGPWGSTKELSRASRSSALSCAFSLRLFMFFFKCLRSKRMQLRQSAPSQQI